MFLIDTNVWLELLLEQERADEVRQLFKSLEASLMAISEFSLYSIGIILTRLGKDHLFEVFLSDTIEDSGIGIARLDTVGMRQLIAIRRQFQLDFDDAYQYAAAKRYNLIIVSFDRDFDRTDLGRKVPADIIRDSHQL